MKAIIPVAGLGTRLRPHTHTTPKALLMVAGKPILAHILDSLVTLGADEVTFIVHYFGDVIEDYVRKNYKFHANFVEQPELLGLGHAISLAKPFHKESGAVLIILGDTIFSAHLTPVLNWSENAIGVKQVGDPRRFGIVELDGERVRKVIEKPENPPTNLAIVGIYNITQPALLFDSLDEIIRAGKKEKGEYQLTTALQVMLDKGAPFRTFEIEGWFDCGKPETLLATNRELLLRASSAHQNEEIQKRYPSAIIKPPVFIAPSVVITDSVVGPYVTVSEGAVIENSIVKNSILSQKAHVKNIVLEDSLIGDNAKAGSNPFRLNVGDSSEIDIR